MKGRRNWPPKSDWGGAYAIPTRYWRTRVPLVMSFRRRLFCSHGSGGARRRSTAAAETGTRVPVVSMCRSEWVTTLAR
ncbi:hypothetical protein HanPSC8_Chr09g0400151 [Helianthus annuus]|nr:hypothetical protein HanPSC8_Chr09g0400151 [Helianthus annuus]